MPIELTRAEIAELRKCSPSTVSRAHLPQTSGGKYDLCDPHVWAYVIEPELERGIKNAIATKEFDLEDAALEELQEEKLKKEIVWKEEQTKKIKLERSLKERDALYKSDVAKAFGAFIAGLKVNYLQIGTRISRGDIKLRKKIEDEVKKATEKTIKNAQKEIQKIIKLELED